MNSLPEIRISPLEGDHFLKRIIPVLSVLLVLALVLKSTLSIFFWILIIVVGFFVFTNLYGRLASKWRRLHFPLMVRYAAAVGFVHGICKKRRKEFDVELALLCLLQSVFPNVPSAKLENYLKEILVKQNNFADERSLRQIFKEKIPKIKKTELEKIIEEIKKSFTSQEKKVSNSIKVRLVIAELIKEKYGEDERLEYLYAVVAGRAI